MRIKAKADQSYNHFETALTKTIKEMEEMLEKGQDDVADAESLDKAQVFLFIHVAHACK